MDILDLINNFGSKTPIPVRDPNAVEGSVFIKNNWNNPVAEREANILEELLKGNIPDFLRNFSQITVNDGNNSIIYLCTNDALSIGSNDYIRIPMNPLTAQKVADLYDCTLPTVKMVNQ